jgi:hypothetical protein
MAPTRAAASGLVSAGVSRVSTSIPAPSFCGSHQILPGNVLVPCLQDNRRLAITRQDPDVAGAHLLELAGELATAALREAVASGDRDAAHDLAGRGPVPLLLAISDNGPQMRSVTTRKVLAGVAIAQQFGRPHTPQDQAWIETLFGHVKGQWPHLEKIRDPGELDADLDRVRAEYNTVRRHASIGYVTPTTSTKAAAKPSGKPAATASPRRA